MVSVAKRGLIAATLLLASCIPAAKPPPRSVAAKPIVTEAELRQCLADLTADGVAYKQLPDRSFGGGCSARGTVQLLDIGTPVTNLGPMTCPLALHFERWAREAVQPASRSLLGSNVARIESFGTYSCRGVDGQPGARLSEHARSNAVDIGAFVLGDGRRVTVLGGWNGDDDAAAQFLRAVHDAGCRRFSVTLGPAANALHRNHLHFDMGRGPYCR